MSVVKNLEKHAGDHLGIEKVRSSLLEKYWWFGTVCIDK